MNVVAGLGTRIVKGKQADKSLILDKVGALRAQADDRHQNDLAALKQVQESESQMRAQLAQQREEKANLIKQLEAQRLNEAQLRRALSLGAERLAKAQQVELQLRAELEEQNSTLHQFELEVQDLSHRLRDEKGVGAQLKHVRTLQSGKSGKGALFLQKPPGLPPVDRSPQAVLLGRGSPPQGVGGSPGTPMSRPMGGASSSGAGAEVSNPADMRLRREQTKRLLHFLKARLTPTLTPTLTRTRTLARTLTLTRTLARTRRSCASSRRRASRSCASSRRPTAAWPPSCARCSSRRPGCARS